MKVTVALGNAAFCMKSEGEGVFDNQATLDAFAWSFESSTPPFGGSGFGVTCVRAGDPGLSAPHGCTYNVPCGTDPTPFTQMHPPGSPCGHGFGTEDHWWMNIDGDTWGDTLNTGVTCPGQPASTGCYWVLGYPGNPFASFWLKLGSAGACAGCTGSPLNYCTAGTTTNGCAAIVSMNGVPSPRNLAPCNIVVTNVEGAKTGLIFYGTNQIALPWGTSSSFLCVKSPTQRILSQPTGGTNGQCNGSMSNDINAYFAATPAALGQPIYAGEVLNFQGWFRDPPSPKTTNLSNGLQITMCP
jgi:hypothetical protein